MYTEHHLHSDDHRVPISKFFTELSNLMESVILSKEHLLVLGDFNIYVDVSNDINAEKFLDLLDSLGLKQNVTEPTHVDGHTLDLIITRKFELVLRITPKIGHYFLIMQLFIAVLPSKSLHHMLRKFLIGGSKPWMLIPSSEI